MYDKVPLKQFKLVGSRSKLADKLTEFSDWDFAAQDSEENRAALVAAGFTEMVNITYKDDVTKAIFSRHFQGPEDPQKHLEYQVQVALKSDYDLFVKAWDTISPEFFIDYIWKTNNNRNSIRRILNQLFRTVTLCAKN